MTEMPVLGTILFAFAVACLLVAASIRYSVRMSTPSGAISWRTEDRWRTWKARIFFAVLAIVLGYAGGFFLGWWA